MRQQNNAQKLIETNLDWGGGYFYTKLHCYIFLKYFLKFTWILADPYLLFQIKGWKNKTMPKNNLDFFLKSEIKS